jgi:hypothetical protein
LPLLPISITILLATAAGSRLSTRFTVRAIVRAGLATTVLAVLILLATIEPELRDVGFAVSMAILGVGMGLMVSQLGNVVQSSVDASGRGEAGSSLGVALIGAIVLTGLTSAFVTTVQSDQRISAEVSAQVGVAVGSGIDFVSADQVQAAAEKAGLDEATTAAVVDDYAKAQLGSLKVGLLTAVLLALLALMFTRDLPHGPPAGRREEEEDRSCPPRPPERSGPRTRWPDGHNSAATELPW